MGRKALSKSGIQAFFPPSPLPPAHHCYFNAAAAVSVQWGDRKKMKVWVQRANRCEDGGMETKVLAMERVKETARTVFSTVGRGDVD